MINIGEEIRIAWERKIGRTITCTSCLQYLRELGSTIPDDHAAFVLELYKNLPFPTSVSKRISMIESQQLIVDTIRPVMSKAGLPFDVSEVVLRNRSARKQSREPSSVFGRNRITVKKTLVDPDRFCGRCCAITSLNPNPARQARQQRCLESWRDIGLPIIAVNTRAEIKSLLGCFPHVEFVSCETVSTEYDRPTQRISSLIEVGSKTRLPFMLINSDIEIRGDHELIETALSRSSDLTIGIRYNHDSETDLNDSHRESHGLDVFLMTPELAATVPDLPFAIGKPVWDYWLPQHFRSLGHDFNWIKTPFFFHESHTLGWSQEDWKIGSDWILESCGVNVGDSNFRELLERRS